MILIDFLGISTSSRKHNCEKNYESVNIVFHIFMFLRNYLKYDLLDLISRFVSDWLNGWKPYR